MSLPYDSTRDEYKVVLIETVFLTWSEDVPSEDQVWIFGLRSNSWRRVLQTDFIPAGLSWFKLCEYSAHGDLYFLCKPNANKLPLDIVAFDVAKERFSLVTQPIYPTEKRVTNLHVLDGCLCISFLSIPEEKAILYVGKKLDGADFTWSILYSVTQAQLPPFFDIYQFREVQVLGYSKEGDNKIMLNLYFWYMISYDLNEKSFQTTAITYLINSDYHVVKPCFESLVSVGDGDLQDTIKTGTETEP